MIIAYISFTLLIFFLTFFAGVFIRYFKTKTITPGKMLSIKKGGVFEFYPVVFGLVAVLIILHALFGMNPFEADSLYAEIIGIIPLTFVFFLFSVFVLVFVFYVTTRLALKLRKVDNPAAYYDKHSTTMITIAIWISVFFAAIFLIGSLYVALVL